MEVRQLQYFLSVLEHGSLGRAAQNVHISEPAISKSIRRLEEELGVKLLDRGSKGMTPTIFGQALAARARVIIGEIETSRRELSELSGAGVGTVKVGFRPSFGSTALPQAVASLQKTRANVRVVMREGPVTELTRGLTQGDLDFVVATEISDLDSHLIQEPLLKSRVGVLVGVGHAAAKLENPRPEHLADSNWILPLSDDPIRAPLVRLLDSIGAAGVHVVAETNSLLTIMSLVHDNQAVAFFPKMMTGRIEQMHGLVLLEIPGLVWHRTFHVVRRRGVTMTPAARMLLDELIAVIEPFAD